MRSKHTHKIGLPNKVYSKETNQKAKICQNMERERPKGRSKANVKIKNRKFNSLRDIFPTAEDSEDGEVQPRLTE